MSRVAKAPVALPKGVDVKVSDRVVNIKGKNGALDLNLHDKVEVKVEDGQVVCLPTVEAKDAWAFAGTTRALINNMVKGVDQGFEKKLELVGVGYRCKVAGKTLNLTLGFSHPVDFEIPEGIKIETPSQTEILVKGVDKQLVGQVAADIRAYRPPEPYKGKGVRYADEHIIRKETKKK